MKEYHPWKYVQLIGLHLKIVMVGATQLHTVAVTIKSEKRGSSTSWRELEVL